MKLVKSLMLGSVAGLAAVAGAQAADLPVKKAAPVEYVRVCSTYGAGFFYIPGTDTCLRVGGRVRAQYIYGEPLTRAQDATGFYTRGRIQVDARTATAYGLLRTFVRYELTRTSGTAFRGPGGNGVSAVSSNLAEAFVQFGGLTAGRVVSMFSNGDLPTGHFGTLRFDDAPDVDLLAYTFTFGNGFSATISLEDGLQRREGLTFGDTWAAAQYAGQRVPDVVGNIKYTGTWGTAQLSGAVHQIRSNNLFTVATPFGPVSDFPDTEYGFAVSFQGSVNLPQLAPGDALWLAATFADGAPAYLDGGNAGTIISPFASFENGTPTLVDASIDPLTGDLKKTRAWSVAGGLRHYWTPQIRSNFFGSYLSSDSRQAFNTPADFREYRLGANVIWQPVSGLDLGVEVIYANTDLRGVNPATGLGFRNSNGWESRIRVQRDF
jgi:hypothetical protein